MRNIIYLLLCISFSGFTQSKDTLFIKYNDMFLEKKQDFIDNSEIYHYYFIKNSGENGGIMFFEEKHIISLDKVIINNLISIEDLLDTKDNFYYKGKLVDSIIFNYIMDLGYSTFFLLKDNKLIEVSIVYETE